MSHVQIAVLIPQGEKKGKKDKRMTMALHFSIMHIMATKTHMEGQEAFGIYQHMVTGPP